MKANEFVIKLAEVSPSIQDYLNCDLPAAEAQRFYESYQCHKRETTQSLSKTNELISLIDQWDTSNVEVGMVRLADAIIEYAQGLQVGVVEADPLVVCHNNELLVYELNSCDHILWHVAKSGGDFLSALVVAAEFLGQRAIGKIDYLDFNTAKKIAKQCSDLAGGDKYLDFYNMLLCAEE